MRNLAIEAVIIQKINQAPATIQKFQDLESFCAGDLGKAVYLFLEAIAMGVAFDESEKLYLINNFDVAPAYSYFTKHGISNLLELMEIYMD